MLLVVLTATWHAEPGHLTWHHTFLKGCCHAQTEALKPNTNNGAKKGPYVWWLLILTHHRTTRGSFGFKCCRERIGGIDWIDEWRDSLETSCRAVWPPLCQGSLWGVLLLFLSTFSAVSAGFVKKELRRVCLQNLSQRDGGHFSYSHITWSQSPLAALVLGQPVKSLHWFTVERFKLRVQVQTLLHVGLKLLSSPTGCVISDELVIISQVLFPWFKKWD